MFVATAILIGETLFAVTNGHIAANFVDKPARLIIRLIFGFLSDPQSYVNSSQFAAISFKRAYFSVSSSSSRAKSMRQDHSGDGHDTTSSATITSHCNALYERQTCPVYPQSTPSPSSRCISSIVISNDLPWFVPPFLNIEFYHLEFHPFYLKIISVITSISMCFIQSLCFFGLSYIENLTSKLIFNGELHIELLLNLSHLRLFSCIFSINFDAKETFWSLLYIAARISIKHCVLILILAAM